MKINIHLKCAYNTSLKHLRITVTTSMFKFIDESTCSTFEVLNSLAQVTVILKLEIKIILQALMAYLARKITS